MKKDVTFLLFFGAALLFAVPLAQAQVSSPGSATIVIPQIVDGGPWMTIIALTNTSAYQASASLSFFQDTGGGNTSPWPLNFVEMTSAQTQALFIPAGSTVFLHTLGTATTTTIGSSTAQTLVPALVGGGQVNYGSFTPSLVVTKNMPIQ